MPAKVTIIRKLSKSPMLINAALFQCVWFACVIGSAYQLLWPAALSCLALMVWQLHPIRRHTNDFKLLALSVLLALVVDTTWIQIGFMQFTDQRLIAAISPLWIILLWMGFALTINHSLAWLSLHPLLPVAMGLIGGPLSYYAGLRIGAVEYLRDPLLISACLALAWGLSMVIMVRLGQGKQVAAKSKTR
jgi:hypothetical protein